MTRPGLLLLGISALLAGTASAQDTLTLDTPISGRYSDAPVFYTIAAQGGQTVLIELTAPDADLALEVSDAAGNFLASDDNSGPDGNPALGVTFPVTGDYRLAVVAYGGQATSDFTLRMSALPVLDTAPIALGEVVRSVVGAAPPRFTLTLTEPTSVLAGLLTFNFPPRLSVQDSAGNTLNSAESSYLLTMLPAGTFTFTLEDALNYPGANRYYALLFEAVAITPLAAGQPIAEEATGGVARFFTFEGRAGDVIDLALTAQDQPLVGAFFTLRAPDPNLSFFSESTPTTSYLTGLTLPADGTYFVDVFPIGGRFRHGFNITLAPAEILAFSAEPTTITFGTDIVSRNVAIAVEQGRTYRLSLRTDNPARAVSVFSSPLSLNMLGTSAGAIDFTAMSTGTIQLTLRVEPQLDYQGNLIDTSPANLTITFTEVGQ